MSLLQFFFVVIGGAMIGVVFGGIVSFITTKTCSTEGKTVEPLLMFASAYLAFVFAELFHWSGETLTIVMI